MIIICIIIRILFYCFVYCGCRIETSSIVCSCQIIIINICIIMLYSIFILAVDLNIWHFRRFSAYKEAKFNLTYFKSQILNQKSFSMTSKSGKSPKWNDPMNHKVSNSLMYIELESENGAFSRSHITENMHYCMERRELVWTAWTILWIMWKSREFEKEARFWPQPEENKSRTFSIIGPICAVIIISSIFLLEEYPLLLTIKIIAISTLFSAILFHFNWLITSHQFSSSWNVCVYYVCTCATSIALIR